jgi:EAL domain-containing protein (putative c-di-GMP-specific phosphodiesterase class I)
MNAPTGIFRLPASLMLDHIEPLVHQEGGYTTGKLGDIRLNSAFQPIFSLAHRRAVGYEALLRPQASDGSALSPLAVFNMARDEAESIFLDRLCRIIHTRNFITQADDVSWLFLNVNHAATMYGKNYGTFFPEVLERYQIPPHRIVIEILEGEVHDESFLIEAAKYYKELGCLLAIDDFGAGHSNFERIWHTQPHIVKLDRSIIVRAAASRTVRRAVPNLVSLIHEAGSLVLMEGVETEEEALIAMDSDIDFVQGYYFAKPAKTLLPEVRCSNPIDDLCAKFNLASKTEVDDHKTKLLGYLDAFRSTIAQIKMGAAAHSACSGFLDLPEAERCYLLDMGGRQQGDNLLSSSARSVTDPRFKPLADSSNAIWVRRHYFRRAISQPGEIQVSRPYLSISGGNMCVTLSAVVDTGREMLVLCGDLMWND